MILSVLIARWKYFILTGKTLTRINGTKGEALPYDICNLPLVPENREVLHLRIEQRFHKMIELGFQQEVEKTGYQRSDF